MKNLINCDPKPLTPKGRLEYLRGELRAERMSYLELAELQSLIDHIDPDDVELLEAAGVPERNALNRAPRLFNVTNDKRKT